MSAINESQCKHWAQALVDTGLVKEGGFEYFVVQEPCFGPRDSVTGQITESGEYSQRWPNGMKGVCARVRARVTVCRIIIAHLELISSCKSEYSSL